MNTHKSRHFIWTKIWFICLSRGFRVLVGNFKWMRVLTGILNWLHFLAEFPSCYNKTFVEQYCGTSDCQKNLSRSRMEYNSSKCPLTSLESGKVPDKTIYILMGIYTGIGISGALLVAFLVDNVKVRYLANTFCKWRTLFAAERKT